MPLSLVNPKPGKTRNWGIRGTVSANVGGTLKKVFVEESSGTPDHDAADAIRVQREAQILKELVFGARATRTLQEAVIGYAKEKDRTAKPLRGTQRAQVLGRKRADGTLSPHLLTRFGADTLCNTIDQEMVDAVIDREFPHKVAAATIMNAIIIPLTAVLNYAAKRKWCDIPKFQRLKTGKGRSRWPTYDEADRILAAAMPFSRPLLLFLMMTGARFSEAISLDWNDVNLQERWAVLRGPNDEGTKRNDEDRGIPLHPQVQLVLANLPHREGRVFLTQRGEPYADIDEDENKRGSIKTAWRSTLKRAGISDPIRVHDLRHGFSTWLVKADVNSRIRDEIMGHAATAMGAKYAHVPREDAISAVDRLPVRGFAPDPLLLERLAETWSTQRRRQVLHANGVVLAPPPRRPIAKRNVG